MKFFDVLKMANANLLRNKVRAGLTILAIFVGSFTIILNSGINYGVNRYVDSQLEAAGGEGYLEIMKMESMSDMIQMGGMGSGGPTEYDPDGGSGVQPITEDDLQIIRETPGIIAESVRVFRMVNVEYIQSLENDKRFNLSISQWPSDTLNVAMASGRMVDNNSEEFQIVLAPEFAEALGYTEESVVGETVVLAVALLPATRPVQVKRVEATVVGVQQQSMVGMGRSFVNEALNDALYDASLSALPEELRPDTNFFAMAEYDTSMSEEEVQAMRDRLSEHGLQAMSIRDQVGMMMTFFDAITIVLMIFGGIALLAASIGIVNTLFMAVQERTREIGLMKAMGLSSGKIFLMFSTEAILLGFWGSVVGIGLAFVARGVGNHLAAQTFLSGLPGFTLIEFNPTMLVVITLVIMAIAFVAGTAPARRAAKQDPIDALRYE
ncbi:ABC transporter permease [Candidatus Saccharibacteria bacterium]|nr:ABC transporter permease [Candidatus Saccharibacteria bacterium]